MIDGDTITVVPISVPSAEIEAAYDAAVSEGLLTLPPEVRRKWRMYDGFTYVIELRRGNEYRASEIERLDKAEVPADEAVKKVFAAIWRVDAAQIPRS